ncbi:MAG: aminotransferase class IV [Acidobacteriota bacterium]|nr:aminotransferase class IV [Acidobacteriota bacterium]
MHKFVSFNHQIISATSALLSAVSAAAFYGKGIFTTLAIYNRKPFLWEKHWHRLTSDAKKIGVDLSAFEYQKIETSLLEIIEKNNLTRARVRLTFFDESLNSVWQIESKRRISLLIVTADLRPTSENLRLTVSPFRVNASSPLAGVKSCNYLENLLALENAKASGFSEAVRLNENGEVTSACLANIFWVKGEKLLTSNLKTGCLAGTTRAFILENFAVEERLAILAELNEADEIFLTSAGIGIAKVKSLDGKVFAGELTNQLQKEFSRYRASAA